MATLYILIPPPKATPGMSFEEDMACRDANAACAAAYMKLDPDIQPIVRLHYDLDDAEIKRAVARYQDMSIAFYLVDGSASQKQSFLERWYKFGGSDVIGGIPENDPTNYIAAK